jgi:hypothetical protein
MSFDLIKYLAEGKLLKENKDEAFAYRFINSESKKVKSLEEIPAFIAKLNQALFVDRNVKTLYDTSVRYDITDILKDNLEDILPEEIIDRLKDDATGAIEAIENNDSSFFTEYEEFNDDEDEFEPRQNIDFTKKINQYIKNGSKGNLYLDNTKITSLPDNLKVGGSLDLNATPITSLPNNLKVVGYLNLSKTKITSLPDDLQVGGSLYLTYTPITSLPDDLQVGGSLTINYTKITSLPNDLKVGGDLYVYDTPLSEKYSKEEIKQMYPGIKGEIKL